MISVAEAKHIITQVVTSRPAKVLPLSCVAGLTLAEDVFGQYDIPGYDQSSMDGYAFSFVGRGARLLIKGEMAAGATAMLSVAGNEATRIFTGGPLPAGADTVVMQEKITTDHGFLVINDPLIQQGSNVRLKGAEIRAGELAMIKGTQLTPAGIGFLAGIGIEAVPVYSPPKIGIISTGNELQQPGVPLAFGQVYESNTLMLSAALKRAGVPEIAASKSKDDLSSIQIILADVLAESDIVLLTGGVSVGDYDFVVEAAGLCGISTHFHKIKQRPGKPLFFGSKEGKLVFGLPGNPSSALTCFYEYVLPAIEQMMKSPSSINAVEALLGADCSKVQGLTHFLKGSYEDGIATPLSAQESFRLASYAHANCLICLEENRTGYLKGETVIVHLLPS